MAWSIHAIIIIMCFASTAQARYYLQDKLGYMITETEALYLTPTALYAEVVSATWLQGNNAYIDVITDTNGRRRTLADILPADHISATYLQSVTNAFITNSYLTSITPIYISGMAVDTTGKISSTSTYMGMGEAEDDDYTDGLWVSINGETKIGTMMDRINEVLGSLAPSAAPALDDVDIDTNGETSDITWDAGDALGGYANVTGIGALGAVNVDGSFADSGDRAGVIATAIDTTGTLNEDVAADADGAYPANAFGNADQGDLKLEVNGVVVRTIDLTNASAVDDGTATSGFDISASTSVEFPNSDPFDVFKYRTGSWRIDSGDANLTNGWNYVKVTHTISGSDTDTNYVDWVVDDDTTDTTYSSDALQNLVMGYSGAEPYLSGVRYFETGVANYVIDIDNAFRNTYKTGDAITFIYSGGTVSNQSLGNSGGNQALQKAVDEVFTVSTSRKLNASITCKTEVDRTFNTNESNDPSDTKTITGLLQDPYIHSSPTQDDNTEGFDAEGYRQESTFDITDVTYASGTGNGVSMWDATESLVGADAGHNDGLLVYNDALRYPKEGALSGDFSSVSNGPAANPDYSAAAGERTYIRYFYDASSRSNFRLGISVSGCTWVAASNIGGLASTECACEILAPNTTQDVGATVEFKDMKTAYTDDDSIGAYASAFGSSIPDTWGGTIGTRSTSTSGNVLVIRLTIGADWTGNISHIEMTFL
ncbi:MAG: hypothetical protein GY853_13410 [PVC group bacterium]|nr:hypothetical protein [PVC group bacterium]